MTDKTSPTDEAVQKIIDILHLIKSTINDKTDVWSGYNKPQEIINKLDLEITNLRFGNLEYIGDIYALFLPTGTLQEVSISNGWGNEFLELASQFDSHYTTLKSTL